MNSPVLWNIFVFMRVLYGGILLGTVREYINQSTKIVRLECHLRFNYECLSNNVVPRSLYCKTLVDTPYGRKLARDFSRNCLKARIQDKQQIHQLRERAIRDRRKAGGKVHVPEDLHLPGDVVQVLGLGPKFGVQKQRTNPELLTVVRQVSRRATEGVWSQGGATVHRAYIRGVGKRE
ncbi:hypothetical protein HPB52_013324 [Rhipicephalus sanguineus]|uniref:Uncharacterized protein n=1 Tax=Rhipicephalus sanguineus TaxID=34632 RepID=A0A9D4QAZ4_RHISA|nr:hypothetical protein HPB52_013324 [Rhipicephalus sanguineus]